MIRAYISGPITGIPHDNLPAFVAEAAKLRAEGLHVESPIGNIAEDGRWETYMRLAIAQLVTCDRIHLLPGWSNSRGASIEYDLAVELGLQVTGAAA